jgi:hypothetical protein
MVCEVGIVTHDYLANSYCRIVGSDQFSTVSQSQSIRNMEERKVYKKLSIHNRAKRSNNRCSTIHPRSLNNIISYNQESRVTKLLSTFCNVENLAIWAPFPTSSQVLKMMNDLPLRRLCVDLEETTLDEAIQHCPAFKNLTHLELITLKGSTWDDYKPLVEFTKLTHLCFDLLPQAVKDEVVWTC